MQDTEFSNYQAYAMDPSGHNSHLVAGPTFDPDSIMIYSSDFGTKDGMLAHTLRTPRIDPSYNNGRMSNLVYTGGNADPRQARISGLDIERVKQLYPLQTPQRRGESAQGGSHRKMVIIGTNYTTTVPPLPGATSFELNSKEGKLVGGWNRAWSEDV